MYLETSSKNYKGSLYLIIAAITIVTIFSVMSLQATYTYFETKKKIIENIKNNSKSTITSLQKNIVNLIESYSVNEYEKLILNEMQFRDVFAVIVEDYNMGKILGQHSYLSGKIRNEKGDIVDYDSKNIQQNKNLEECFYFEKHEIVTDNGTSVGKIAIYTSDRLMIIELNKIITRTIIEAVVIFLVLVTLIFSILHFSILRPLFDMVKVLSDNDDDGIPTKLVKQEGYKEIFLLSSTINNMISSIKKSRIKLKNQQNELIKQKNILHHQAHHDFLTGLPNRVLFNSKLEGAIEKASRNESMLALLFIDLDHFKEINDSMGHTFGDEILKVVTRKLQTNIRKTDTLARLGGDEFIVIMEDLEQIENASMCANKIIEILCEPLIIQENKIYISSSIGISIYPNDGQDAQDLFKYADAAMYKAKDEGRNNYQYYSTEMTQRAHERVFMETSLRNALKNEEFLVYYQPQINGKTKEVTGMEALVRWQHPSLGLISPAKFIPLAESTGLIVELDRLVMKMAMSQFSSWYKNGFKPGVLAMNLSIKHLQQKDFIEMIESLMLDTQCMAQWIELEVTESQIMVNPEKSIEILNKLVDIGIELAIDDFGTGYSSLSYLKKLPINKLKVDQSFVNDLPHDDEDVAITKAVIALAKSLNLKIIAEGVETKEQEEFLVKNGCENIQGYLYSKPIPAAVMQELFLKN